MFDATSRYYKPTILTTDIRDSEGRLRQVSYVRWRIISPPDPTLTVIEHIFSAGDRLDTITARYLGDPLLFWQICDANNVLSPAELEDPGHVIKINAAEL
jgi:hypothetical protein